MDLLNNQNLQLALEWKMMILVTAYVVKVMKDVCALADGEKAPEMHYVEVKMMV